MAVENKVGKYTIIKKIAEGGMGAIYKAKHPTLNRTVILKKLTLKRNNVITERFKREAQMMIDFRHDNIVQVYDHFKEGSAYYIVMEFIDGISLRDLIEKKRYLPNTISMLIFREICRALRYAHECGVIHRDIKPDNVLISKEGEVKLTDFGIATSKEFNDETLTSEGMTLGTPSYMAPEQIHDTKNVDKRADIYSMGVLLYVMVTGKTPFPGSFTPETIALIQKGKYIPPRRINPKISTVIHKVIKKAMHCKVKRRYKDLDIIVAIFSKYLKKFKTTPDIEDTIRTYVYENKVIAPAKNLFSRLKNALPGQLRGLTYKILLLLLLLSGGGYYGYLKGWHYEYFLDKTYGAFQVNVLVDNAYKDLSGIQFSANLFRKKGRGFVTIPAPVFKHYTIEKNKKKHNYNIVTDPIYLPSADYKIQIEVDNQLYQREFFLKPRIRQKVEKYPENLETIKVSHSYVKKLPLKVEYTLRDNNDIITADSECFLRVGRQWILWEKFLASEYAASYLTSGKMYQFKFTHDGYYNRYVKISVEPYQTVLSLDYTLLPVPGSLFYKTDHDTIEVLLNNNTHYVSGGKKRDYTRIPAASSKYQRLLLRPGKYFFTARKSTSISQTIPVVIESKQSKRIVIVYDNRNEKIQLTIK